MATRIALILLALQFTTTSLGAQTGTVLRDVVYMEQRVDDRWLNSAQSHLFTPFRQERIFTVLGGQTPEGAGTMAFLASFPGLGLTTIAAIRFIVAGDGTLVRADAQIRPLTVQDPVRAANDSASHIRNTYNVNSATRSFVMPEARVWDLVPVVRATPLRLGVRWSDTLKLSASRDEHSQTLSGIRNSRVVGDTTVAGVRLWIIEDSTVATVNEKFFQDDAAVSTRVS